MAVLADPEGNEFCVLATRANDAGITQQQVASGPSVIETAQLCQRVVVWRGALTPRISGVDHADGFDEHRVHLAISDWAVLDTSRHHEQLTWAQSHIAVAQLDGQFTVDDEEQFVGVVMGVPDELALDFHDFDLVVVQ
jgi:hypothetical protein